MASQYLLLKETLSDPVAAQIFRQFLDSEYCTENFYFWVQVETFKALKDDKQVQEKAQEIYKTYLAKSSAREINISSEHRADLEAKFESQSFDKKSFNQVQKTIFVDLLKGVFPRFLASDYYKKYEDSRVQKLTDILMSSHYQAFVNFVTVEDQLSVMFCVNVEHLRKLKKPLQVYQQAEAIWEKFFEPECTLVGIASQTIQNIKKIYENIQIFDATLFDACEDEVLRYLCKTYFFKFRSNKENKRKIMTKLLSNHPASLYDKNQHVKLRKENQIAEELHKLKVQNKLLSNSLKEYQDKEQADNALLSVLQEQLKLCQESQKQYKDMYLEQKDITELQKDEITRLKKELEKANRKLNKNSS